MRRYLKPDLVVIDDMGLKALPENSGEYLLEVIMRRYENRSTIMTSNRPLEDWGKLLSDVPTAGAILDRFLHHAITHRHQRPQLPGQRLTADGSRSEETKEIKRTLGRRRRELRLKARHRLDLSRCQNPCQKK